MTKVALGTFLGLAAAVSLAAAGYLMGYTAATAHYLSRSLPI